MFGYAVPNRKAMSEEETERYRSLYCSVCMTLREKGGLRCTAALNYDLVFLLMILNSLYEPAETEKRISCPFHPFAGRDGLSGSYLSYVSDIGLLLAHYKCEDDWKDDRDLMKHGIGKLLEKAVAEAENRRGSKASVIRTDMERISRMENQGCDDIEELSSVFGHMLGECFAEKEDDFFSNDLRLLGSRLGKYIYVLDACDDAETDRKKGRFNPLLSGKYDLRWRKEALGILLADTAEAFEMLPLERDASILENIIYSGLVMKIPAELREGKEEKDVKRSV